MREFLQKLSANKDAFLALQAALTSLAIIVGGISAYLAFGRKREKFPRARLKHTFAVVRMDDGQRILRVQLDVENIGDTLLGIGWVLNRVQQVLPRAITADGAFDPKPSDAEPEIAWPTIPDGERNIRFKLGGREIEPKETDEFHFDYQLDPDVETVQVYSFTENAHKSEIGWMTTTLLDLSTATTFPMSKNPNNANTETRQGAPKVQPTQATGGNAQGSPKQSPTNTVANPKSK